ncbi:hypothetical protein CPB86DRAFT_391043 [Serendipita vermifera]|nr:hypothetical protein CPB86DRAFT_391043 [Serendipita vermifera]
MISHLPELASFTMDEYRGIGRHHENQETKAIETFCQVSNGLRSIGFNFFDLWSDYCKVVWQAASPAVVELSRDAKGGICIWTPDPSDKGMWPFWWSTFGKPSATRRAMMERWPGAAIPSISKLEASISYHTFISNYTQSQS